MKITNDPQNDVSQTGTYLAMTSEQPSPNEWLVDLAKQVSQGMVLSRQATSLTELSTVIKTLTELQTMLKEQIKAAVLQRGRAITDKGSMQLEEDGWMLEIRPKNTKYDDRKVEAAARARGWEPEALMDPVVTYTTNVEKLCAAIPDPAERDVLRHDVSYVVQTPKRIVGEDSDD